MTKTRRIILSNEKESSPPNLEGLDSSPRMQSNPPSSRLHTPGTHHQGPDVAANARLVSGRGQKHSRDSEWNTAQVMKSVNCSYKERIHLLDKKGSGKKRGGKSKKDKLLAIVTKLKGDPDFQSQDFQNKKDEAYESKIQRLIKNHEEEFGYSRMRVNVSRFAETKELQMEPYQK